MGRAGDLLRALLLAAPLSAAGCDQDELTNLARKVVFDLSSVGFTADRRFTAEYGGEPLEWVERVRSAGDGEIVVVELISRNGRTRDQISDPIELAAFDRLSGMLAAGGGPRVLFQRDPAPDDLDRMIENYYVTVVELGREPVTPRGEPSITYRLDPVWQDRPFYVLTVSTGRGREGFPLECQEYVREANGPRLVSHMVVLPDGLTWGPADVTAPASPIVSRTELDSLKTARESAARNGLALYLPRNDSLPIGFELAKVEEVQYQTDANLARQVETVVLYRFVYSDGVEHIDVIEHAPNDTLPSQFLRTGGSRDRDLAMIARFGSITIGSLLHSGTLVTIESRVAADRFEPMMRALVRL